MTEVERCTPVDAWTILMLGGTGGIWAAMLSGVVYAIHHLHA